MDVTALRVLIAGGGTGGHLFPGLAIAEALRRRAPRADVRFVGSAYGIEHTAVPARGYRLYRLPVRGLYHVPLRRRLYVLAMAPLAVLRCVGILLTFRPHLVIGVGGYASGPMLATALLLGRRCVIQEQNAYPGLTNRLLGRWVRRAFVPVAGLDGIFPRATVVGNPVRQDILALRAEASTAPREPLLLVVGGSQGAHRVNEALVEALPLLAGADLRILHQTGPADLAWVRQAYQAAGVPAEIVAFIDDMASAFRRCRLVVSRAGASAVAEIITARRAAILVPIPGTSGDHQLKNAQWVAGAGAGVLLEQAQLSGAALAREILALLGDGPRLARMEAATDALYPGDAAARIVEECLGLLH
ncbi:MAG: undecaprenyldiphospho-muramoylpentapeptide beta-N-acetylglucosaminyltransferase [Candidatus Lambdaproteobacteria bacterium]|nr:undecaprenyldiphospho-muramoylpentapeptide beta-N-acetylglucosaminyltransferase [Candidatus Lambdaproteobacteria bacterium]